MADPDRAGDFIEACIDRPDEARRMAAADPSVLYLERIGSPMLHWFVIEDFPAAVQLVLELGVPVDYRDKNDSTALHYACRLGRLGSARILLERGADPNARLERLGENPLNLAIAHGTIDVIILLLSHAARADYLLPGNDTVFSAMAGLSVTRRSSFEELLRQHGITREGLFRSLGLDETYESPEQAFGW